MCSPTPAPHEPPLYKIELFVIVRVPGGANFWCKEPTTWISHADSTKSISHLWCSTHPPDPRCKSDREYLGGISATALATVMLLIQWLYCRNTQKCPRAHSPWIKETQKSALDPKYLRLKHQKGRWKHWRQKSSAHWYNLDAIRGLQWGKGSWISSSDLQIREREENHQVKILGGRCHICTW